MTKKEADKLKKAICGLKYEEWRVIGKDETIISYKIIREEVFNLIDLITEDD